MLFRGIERRRGDFCCSANEPLGDNPELWWGGFTEAEQERAGELTKPFNDRFHNSENSDNSITMHTNGMDKDGFIFAVADDFTDDTVEIVHEKDLESFLVRWFRPRKVRK
ncbi:MAG: hypothetical protein ABSB35_41290 [Bryobacteraceae bacterium]